MSGKVTTIISDFGGVLTTPLMNSFLSVQDRHGISPEQFGKAIGRILERDGIHPLYELEKGLIPETDFLDRLRDGLEPELGHRPELHRFSEAFFAGLDPNEPMIELMRELKADGLRMALLTNNVREWEPHWRAMMPIDEIFELVVDSAFVGVRKPEPEIYEITLERLGRPDPAECLFIDDVELNVEGARALGIGAVHYREPDQAVAEIRAAVAGDPTP